MNGGSKKSPHLDDARRSRPTTSYGGLPTSFDDVQQVTTEASSGPYRSVGYSSFPTPDVGPGLGLDPPSLSRPSLPSLSRDRGYGFGKTHSSRPKDSFSDCFSDAFSPFESTSTSSSKVAPVNTFSSSSSSSSHHPWNVDDEALPPKPDFYTLEPTTTFVPHCRPSVVASRVSNFLLKRGVSATYNGAKAKAKCVTADDVEFRVRLYRGKKQFSHGVIVEVQRRFGFSVTFHRDAMGILDVAAGKPVMPALEEPFSYEHADKGAAARAQLIY